MRLQPFTNTILFVLHCPVILMKINRPKHSILLEADISPLVFVRELSPMTRKVLFH